MVKALKSLIWLENFAINFPFLLERTPIYCLFYFCNVIFIVTKHTLFGKKNQNHHQQKPQPFLFLPAIKLLHGAWGKADIEELNRLNNVFVHFTFIRMEKLQKKYMGFQFHCSLFDFVSKFLINNSTSLLLCKKFSRNSTNEILCWKPK